jgi:hypothetical protein
MARISLYVPDELKTRMDTAAEINWSDVARPALTAAIAAFEHRKGPNMTTAIERLRASKQRTDQEEKLLGKSEGRKWAEDTAEYRWLQRLYHRRKDRPVEDPRHALECALDLDEAEDSDYGAACARMCYPLSRSRSDEYMEAFVGGAVGFFEQVREEVEQLTVVSTDSR